MKKLLTIILILALALPALALAESTLSSNEQNFLGAWIMYANGSSGKQYVIVTTFLDNLEVVQRSMTFTNGILTSDNKATGEWSGFTDQTIIFTLAGKGMTAMIKDDGYLYMYFFDNLSLCGIFSRCEDMAEKLGW